jgi:hypothetical protein
MRNLGAIRDEGVAQKGASDIKHMAFHIGWADNA